MKLTNIQEDILRGQCLNIAAENLTAQKQNFTHPDARKELYDLWMKLYYETKQLREAIE